MLKRISKDDIGGIILLFIIIAIAFIVVLVMFQNLINLFNTNASSL